MKQEKQKMTVKGWNPGQVDRKDKKSDECIHSYDGSHQSTDVPKDKAKSPIRER